MISTVKSKIELAHCTLSIYKNNIVLIKIKDDAEINLENAIEITSNVIGLTNHQPFKIIVDARNIFGTFKSKARDHFANNEKYNQLRLKSAVIVNNISVRLLINFYRKVHLKKNNIKIVKDFEEALAWVK
jgi:hypothetical protein